MSDTTTTPPPEELPPTPTPDQPPAEQPAPEGEPEGQPRDEQGRFKAPDEQTRFEKRIGVIRAQLSQTARQRDELAARIAAIEQRIGGAAPGQPQVDPQLQAYVEKEAENIAEKKRMEERIASFHEDGSSRYPADWKQRCDDLQAMGADFHFARLLVTMPDGAKVAGALRDDPETVERIASMPPDARPFALGQYLAKLDAQPTRQVSKAPAPPKPLPGRSSPMPNPYLMEANDLAAMWMKEALEAQRRR